MTLWKNYSNIGVSSYDGKAVTICKVHREVPCSACRSTIWAGELMTKENKKVFCTDCKPIRNVRQHGKRFEIVTKK